MDQNYRTARLLVTMMVVVTAAAASIAGQVAESRRAGVATDTSYQSPGKEKYTALKIPKEIHAPAGEHFSFSVLAIGVQIYVCKPIPQEPSKFEWKFVAPEADLFDSEGRLIGRHFLDQANGGPAWELNNGSKVVADTTRLKRHDVGNSIPWLLLPKKVTAGDGELSNVKSIQRLLTVGGKTPTEAPDKSQEGKELRVYYSATYYFNN
jgi:hypothetical protein